MSGHKCMYVAIDRFNESRTSNNSASLALLSARYLLRFGKHRFKNDSVIINCVIINYISSPENNF